MKIGVLDCETTGLDTQMDCVVELYIRDLDDPEIAKLWRFHPLKPIPEDISKIHGITNEDVMNCPTFGEMADEVRKFIERFDVLAGYNPDFDINMLRLEFKRSVVNVAWPKTVVCAKRLWDIYDPPPKRNLIMAYQRFVDGEGYKGAHGAMQDVNATCSVLRAQLVAFNLAAKPWAELDPERARWFGHTDHVMWNETMDTLMITFGKFAGKPFKECDKSYLNYILKNDFPQPVKNLANEQLRQLASQQSTTLEDWARGNR